MKVLIKSLLISLMLAVLASCSSVKSGKHSSSQRTVQKVRIANIAQSKAGSELLIRSMSLIGTPYRYGGSSRSAGFDCSGLVNYVYKQALNVNLPRTARDLAAASSSISKRNLKVGDLVFFNTSGKNPYSHVGIYIGNQQFIHAPSSKGKIRTENLNHPYFAKRFTGARTFF